MLSLAVKGCTFILESKAQGWVLWHLSSLDLQSFFGVSKFGVGGILWEQLHSLYGWFIKVSAVEQDVSRSLEELLPTALFLLAAWFRHFVFT